MLFNAAAANASAAFFVTAAATDPILSVQFVDASSEIDHSQAVVVRCSGSNDVRVCLSL